MCNEIEERLVQTYIGTITDESTDPVQISVYPDNNPDAVEYGAFPKSIMIREGINLVRYETFVVDSWESPEGRTRLEVRPHIYRTLSDAEMQAIRNEIDAIYPPGWTGFDDY